MASINMFPSNQKPFEHVAQKQKTVEIQVGSSNIIVDLIRNILSIPTKFLLLNTEINSGDVTEETVNTMREYLDENGLHDVAISVNQYKPQWIWSRIFTNPKTSFLSKCTLGIAAGLVETLSIPKLTGIAGDHYEFPSNTIHLFSNDVSVALHECGHAKDYNQQEYPSLYCMTKALPVVGPLAVLYQESVATENAITYLREKKSGEGVKQAFKVLIPAFFTYLASMIVPKPTQLNVSQNNLGINQIDPASIKRWLLGTLGIVAIGHCVGRIMAYLESDPKPAQEEKKTKPLTQIG